jgi:hypothetical protein
MIRIILVLSCLLLVNSVVPPSALGQEPPKSGDQTGPAPRSTAKDGTRFGQRLVDQGKTIDVDADAVADLVVTSEIEDDPSDPNSKVRTRKYNLMTPVIKSTTFAKDFDALETNFGLSLSDADDALRSQLEIPPGQGVVVLGVKAGSLAEQAGLKANDVLLSLGEAPAKESHQVRDLLLKLGKEAVEVKLIREGKPSRMSLVGPKHGFPPESAEYWIGVPVSPVDATLRAHLTTLPADSGLVVNEVVKDSPADQVGVKKDDVLVAMDGKPLATSDTLIAQIQASQGKPVPLQVLRAGKPLTLTITPAKRAHPTVISLRKYLDTSLAYQVVRPNMAIEYDVHQGRVGVAQARPVESKPSPSGGYTLYAPYSGFVVDPYSGLQANPANASNSPFQPLPHQNYFYQPLPNADLATARIEAQLKEIVGKLDEISKALEALKKSAGK